MNRILSSYWRDIHLSEHFTLGEFVVSHDHPDLAAKIIPTIEQADKLYYLCQWALEPIRKEYNRPVTITSGLVSHELNLARGSTVSGSQHLYGEACDFIIDGISMLDPFVFIKAELKWDGELIYYRQKGHIHIALPTMWVKHMDQFIKE